MSYRKSSLRPQRSRRLAPVAARVWQHRVLSQSIESLEERQMLSAVLPGLDDHGVTIRNAQATGLAAINITSMQNARLSNNANGSGLFIELSNVGGALNSLKTISVTGVTIANNGNAGAQIRLTNMALDNLVIDRAVVTGNGGAGLVLDLTNTTIKNLTIWDSTNNFSPAAIRNPNSGASSYNGNRYDGIHLLGANVAIDSLRIAGNVVRNNIGTGIFISTNVANIASLSLQDNEVRGNAINSTAPTSFASGSGIRFQTNRTNLGFVSSAITFNTIVGNAQHGLSFFQQSLIPGNTPTNAPSNFDVGLITDNTFNSNGGSGLSVDLRQQTTWDATVMRNIFATNSLRGFDLKGGDTVDAFNVQIGGLATSPTGVLVNRNTFTNNLGSGIAIELNDLTGDLGNSSGKFAIFGNLITNQRRQNNIYAGEGIRVRIRGDVTRQNGAARIVNSIIDRNTINGNAGDGIRIDVSEDSELTNLLIGNATGPNQTFDVNGELVGGGTVEEQAGDGNVITNNGGNGITIVRLSSAFVKGIKILDNIVTGNAEGIYLQASNTYQTVTAAARPNLRVVTDFTVNTNDLSNNRLNGVHLRTEFNAVLLADMRYNRIDGNGVNGVLVTGLENNTTDFENVGGRWIKNAITNNGTGVTGINGNGIRIATVVGSVNPLIIGQDGLDLLDQQSLGNFIAFNGEDGIEIESFAGANNTVIPSDIRDEAEIVNNLIIANGQNAIGSPYIAGKGIDIRLTQFQARAFRIDRNTIQSNAGDGVEINNHGGQLRLTAVGNFIDINGGRGVDLLNQVGNVNIDAEAFVRFGDKATTLVSGVAVSNRNVVTRNGLEGVYIVNTGAFSQQQDVDAEATLAVVDANTSTFYLSGIANLILDMENNEIRDNGLGVPDLNNSPASTLSGTGLVLRVGSQFSTSAYFIAPDITGDASWFTSAAALGVGSNIIQGGGTVAAGFGTTANGRVNARIVENEFSGNGGDDVFIEPFVSVQPRDTAGPWNQTEFRVDRFDSDPLSRLNLVFLGNTGESIDVVRAPSSTDGVKSYYDNAEGDWKSRTSKPDANPDGPFGNQAGRSRIVTRTGILAYTFPDNVPAGHPDFYYPGLGASTFRIEGNWDVSGFTNNEFGTDFDTLLFPPNPVFTAATYGYDDVAIGTFSYLTAWINDVSVDEGNVANLTVTLTEDAPVGGVTILYRLSDGTALADPNNDGSTLDGDFDPTSVTGSLFIAAGQRTGTISVQVNNDNVFDPGEQFYVDLYQTSDGDFVDSRGIVSIRQAPQITVSSPEVIEGDSGTKVLTYTVNLATDDPTQTISVDYATSNGTATAGSDYVAKSGTITFLPGEMSKTISIVVNGDLVVEGDETLFLTLSNPTGGATLPAPTGTGTIINDDTPSITISDVAVTEGSGNAVFTVTLSKAVASTVTVSFATANGTALNGQDYTARSGMLTFLAGETSKQFTVVIVDDDVTESVETFTVNLFGATNGSIDKAAGTGTINDDDTPSVSITTPVVRTEGDGTTNMVFTLTLSTEAVTPVTVSYATMDQTATAGTDYVAKSGDVTFAAGETTKTIVIQILGDRVIEQTERFTVALSNAVNGNITTPTATGVILDDDTPSITIDDVGVLESDGFAFFTVSLSKAVSGSNVSVDYRTTSGTAASGVDFTATAGTLVFQPGQTSKTIFVQIAQDSQGEPIETFFVDLSMPTNATIADARGVGRIIDAAFATTLVVAPNTGSDPVVKVYGSNPNVLRFPAFYAYDPGFRGGVRVALGDVNGDGVSDIVTSPASGIAPVRVFDGRSGALMSSFFPYSPNFAGGLSIAADDLNGDGRSEIIVGLASNGSAIRVFNGANGVLISGYYAFSPSFLGGVNVAVGDVTGDGRSELIVGLASQGNAIRVLQPITGAVLSAFTSFEGFTGGVNVAVGDVNGDGRGEIIAGMASLGSAIRVFDTANLRFPGEVSRWAAFPGFSGGVSVGTTDLDFDGRAEVIVAPVAHSTPGTRFFNGLTGQSVASTNPFPEYNTGAWVAGDTLDLVGSPLRLDGSTIASTNAAAVTQAQVEALTQAAIAKFAAAGASAATIAKLKNTRFEIGNLPGSYLGLSGAGVVVIDVNAGGRGWFVDGTPNLDEEFARDAKGTYRAVTAGAVGKVDLLSVIVHELAHQLGFDDLSPSIAPNSVLAESLSVSVRRATKENVDDLFADGDLLSELLLA